MKRNENAFMRNNSFQLLRFSITINPGMSSTPWWKFGRSSSVVVSFGLFMCQFLLGWIRNCARVNHRVLPPNFGSLIHLVVSSATFNLIEIQCHWWTSIVSIILPTLKATNCLYLCEYRICIHVFEHMQLNIKDIIWNIYYKIHVLAQSATCSAVTR